MGNLPTFAFLWHSLESLQLFGAGHVQGLAQELRPGQKGASGGESRGTLVKNAPKYLALRGFPTSLASRISCPASDPCPKWIHKDSVLYLFFSEKCQVFLSKLLYLVVTKPFSCLKPQNFKIKTFMDAACALSHLTDHPIHKSLQSEHVAASKLI